MADRRIGQHVLAAAQQSRLDKHFSKVSQPDPRRLCCVALLEPQEEDVTVFDYVVDEEQRSRPFDHPPEEVVHAAIRHGDVNDIN